MLQFTPLFRLGVLALLSATVVVAQTQFRETSRGADLATTGVASGDLDADGDVDLMLALVDGAAVSINDGTGRFITRQYTFSGPSSFRRNIAAADLDRDGDLDGLLWGLSFDDVRILRNDGAAGFGVETPYPWSYRIQGARLADVDRDGDPDFIVVNSFATTLFSNDGSGSFSQTVGAFPPGSLGLGLAVLTGDFDQDGAVDSLVIGSQSAELFLNSGNGQFRPAPSALAAFPPELSGGVVGDFDGDGHLDVLATAFTGNRSLMLGDGRGGFAVASTALPTGPLLEPVAADLDDDGDLDLAGASGFYGPTPRIWINDGRGGLSDATASRVVQANVVTWQIGAADVDGDRDLDLYIASSFALPIVDPLYLNHHRQLSVPVPPRVGGSMRVACAREPGYGTGLGLALAAVGAESAAPIPTPFGCLRLSPEAVIPLPFLPLPAPAGEGVVDVGVPNAPNLIGTRVLVQALLVDPFGNSAPRLTGFERVVVQ